eukprot:3968387-Lingulodinium_polyedra.AAC.1
MRMFLQKFSQLQAFAGAHPETCVVCPYIEFVHLQVMVAVSFDTAECAKALTLGSLQERLRGVDNSKEAAQLLKEGFTSLLSDVDRCSDEVIGRVRAALQNFVGLVDLDPDAFAPNITNDLRDMLQLSNPVTWPGDSAALERLHGSCSRILERKDLETLASIFNVHAHGRVLLKSWSTGYDVFKKLEAHRVTIVRHATHLQALLNEGDSSRSASLVALKAAVQDMLLIPQDFATSQAMGVPQMLHLLEQLTKAVCAEIGGRWLTYTFQELDKKSKTPEMSLQLDVQEVLDLGLSDARSDCLLALHNAMQACKDWLGMGLHVQACL